MTAEVSILHHQVSGSNQGREKVDAFWKSIYLPISGEESLRGSRWSFLKWDGGSGHPIVTDEPRGYA